MLTVFRSKRRLGVLLVVVTSPCLAHAAPIANVTTSAQYQSFFSADAADAFSPGQPAQTFVISHPPVTDYGPSLSEAFARSSIGGSIGARAVAGGWHPSFDPPNACAADATARSTTRWNIRSDTLPLATPISIRVNFRVDGLIGYGDGAGGTNDDPGATVAASFSANGATLFSASHHIGSGGLVGPAVSAYTGGWSDADVSQGQFAYPGFGNPFGARHLDATRTIIVAAAVGDSVEFSSFLEVHARTRGPYELFSFADFSNTADYTLAGVDPSSGLPLDVQFVSVPSPGTALLLGAMLWPSRAHRKRYV